MPGSVRSSFLLTPLDPAVSHSYPRIDSFDIPRAIAIGLMIIVHTLMTYASPSTMQEPAAKLLMLCGTAPGAPTFIFLMGFYFIYARPKTPRYYIIRGLQLIVLGYLLNVARFLLPAVLILQFGIPADVFLPWTPLTFFKDIDILQFAGLALIMLTGIRYILRRPINILLIIVSITLIAPFLWGVQSGYAVLDWILDLLWGKGIYVIFPLFPWLVYPLAGYLFGLALIYYQNEKSFFDKTRVIGLLLFITGLAWSATNQSFHFGDYFRAGYGGTVAMLGFVTLYISSIELLCRQMGLRGRIKGISYLSDNLTPLYFIHWTIIGWGWFSGYTDKLSLNSCFLVMAIVAVLSLIVLKGYLLCKQNNLYIEGLNNYQNSNA